MSEVKKETDIAKLLRAVLYGDTVLFVDGSFDALIINTKGWEKRSISGSRITAICLRILHSAYP